jgi:hypothetical protein
MSEQPTDQRRVRPQRYTRPSDSDICACMGGTKIPCPDYPTQTLDDWASTSVNREPGVER